MGNPFPSKYAGRCKAGCGRTWNPGDDIYGLGSHLCTDPNCKMPQAQQQQPPQAQPQAAPPQPQPQQQQPQDTSCEGMTNIPAEMLQQVEIATKEIHGINCAVIQQLKALGMPYPQPAYVGLITKLIVDKINKSRGGA